MNIQKIKNIGGFLWLATVVGTGIISASQSPDKKQLSTTNSVGRLSANTINFLPLENQKSANKMLTTEKRTLAERLQISLDENERLTTTNQELFKKNEIFKTQFTKTEEILVETLKIMGAQIEESSDLVCEGPVENSNLVLGFANLAQDLRDKVQTLNGTINSLQQNSDAVNERLKLICRNIVTRKNVGIFQEESAIDAQLESLVSSLMKQIKESEQQKQTDDGYIEGLHSALKNKLIVIRYYKVGITLLSAIIILLLCDKYGNIQLFRF